MLEEKQNQHSSLLEIWCSNNNLAMTKQFENFKTLILFILIAGFVIILYFRNSKIESLNAKLAELPKIEYVNHIDTIEDSTPVYITKLIPSKADTEYVAVIKYLEKSLTKEDSLNIGKKVISWIEDYNTTRTYSKIFKDDSSAFVKFSTDIYRNRLVDPELIFKNNYPIYKTITTPNKTEIYGGFGAYTNGLLLNAGVMTKSKIFYQIQTDPINKYYGGQVSFKLFQFK